MNFVNSIKQQLTTDPQVDDLLKDENLSEFGFIGIKEATVSLDIFAFVTADNLSQLDVSDICDRFFNITRDCYTIFSLKKSFLSSGSWLGNVPRMPNGIICFVFEKNCPRSLSTFIREQSRIKHTEQAGVVVPWSIDVVNKIIYTHKNPVSVFPPVVISDKVTFPSRSYLETFLSSYRMEETKDDSSQNYRRSDTQKAVVGAFHNLERKVERLQESATSLSEQERNNFAHSTIVQLATERSEDIASRPPIRDDKKEAVRFFVEALRTIEDNKDSVELIYNFFSRNSSKINVSLLSILPEVISSILSIQDTNRRRTLSAISTFGNLLLQLPFGNRSLNVELAVAIYKQTLEVISKNEMSVERAQTMSNLANAYAQRIIGDRAENIEQAVSAYRQALAVISKNEMPVEWAQTMSNLANAYAQRIIGDRAENIEQAISAYQQALAVLTWDRAPSWAQVLDSLATAYRLRIEGDRAENIEKAIGLYQQALKVRTELDMPAQQASTLGNLANAYSERVRGDRAENIEKAIGLYQQAISIVEKVGSPLALATANMNIANGYLLRIRGDRAENIEKAIELYQQVLLIATRDKEPFLWSTATMNMGNAYLLRIAGDRAQNIEDAINAYQQSLQVRTTSALPIEWAETMANLASAFSNRIVGDRAENLERAIAIYEKSLMVRTRSTMLIGWAATMSGLSAIYANRIRGDREENIEKALEICLQSLSVRTRSAMPLEWAKTTLNLANIYSIRTKGERLDNIDKAINAYQLSLEIFRPEQLPRECRQAAKSLGSLYSEKECWSAASSAYELALEAVEVIDQASLFRKTQESELEITSDLFRQAAYAIAKDGNLQSALTTVEKGRARGLSKVLGGGSSPGNTFAAIAQPLT